MHYTFRKAEISEADSIWKLLQQAIIRRKNDGSNQWQDGYPNLTVVKNDIEKGYGFILVEGEKIIGYVAVMINNEPAYETIDGKWLTNDDFVVIHRVAIDENYLGKGLAKKIMNYVEDFALQNNIYSIKADTNFDNFAMMKIFKNLNYTLCGEVLLRGAPRKAYEKVLK
ncbi:GNAT family N-acetyltransferase [Flavobacterium sp. FBOR7N2.3]|uniref:GNAT family N-acetyltransferase n=1 Tax=Flavobacterium magnesitis TaxID=3138077 RepID=A0ABV4TIH9_9FLAO